MPNLIPIFSNFLERRVFGESLEFVMSRPENSSLLLPKPIYVIWKELMERALDTNTILLERSDEEEQKQIIEAIDRGTVIIDCLIVLMKR